MTPSDTTPQGAEPRDGDGRTPDQVADMWSARGRPAPAAPTNGGGEPLKLDAYYYSFDATGCRPIDLILQAVARAGKAYHHTDSWMDSDTGPSEAEKIQQAANEAAAALQPQPTQPGGAEGREDALRRLEVMRDQARNGTAVTDPNEWEADELDAILAALKTSEARG